MNKAGSSIAMHTVVFNTKAAVAMLTFNLWSCTAISVLMVVGIAVIFLP
jgi:hypothetical protein